jgi:lysophospholipase L1-like esterase
VVTAAALMLGGCGGGATGSASGTGGGSETGGGHRLIAAIGDSITAGYPGYAPDATVFRQFAVERNPKSQWEWWAEKEHPDLEIRNCGVRGERTDQIAKRFDSCTPGADGVVIQGGINDLREGVPGPVVLANLRKMIRAAKRANLDVAVADLLPYGPAPQADRIIDSLNRQIDALARREGATVLHFHGVLEDPKHPGVMKPEWNADGIHPSVEGYRRLGELAFRPPGA